MAQLALQGLTTRLLEEEDEPEGVYGVVGEETGPQVYRGMILSPPHSYLFIGFIICYFINYKL